MVRLANRGILGKGPSPLTRFDRLIINEQNDQDWNYIDPRSELTAGMNDLRTAFRAVTEKKIYEVLRTGRASPAIMKAVDEAAAGWATRLTAVLDDPKYAKLTERIRRRDFDISPCEVEGGRTLPHKFPGFAAAMDSFWPGWNTDHKHFLEYHDALDWAPERIASLGAVFVPNPNAKAGDVLNLLEHMQMCDKSFRTVPIGDENLSVKDARKLLMHYDPDFPMAVIEGDYPTAYSLQGFVTINTLKDCKKPDDEKVSKYMQKYKGSEVTSLDQDSEKVFERLRDSEEDFLFHVSEEDGVGDLKGQKTKKIRAMSQTTASLSKLLPAFEYGPNKGLGSVVYIGMGDVDQSIDYLREAVARGSAGAVIETANGDRWDYLQVVRKIRLEFPDLYIIAGTVTDPVAALELVEMDVDCIKIGIAEGGHCDTSLTGVHPPQAWAALMAGPAVLGKATIIVDSWGDTSEFCKGMAIHSVRGRQAGAGFSARAESAMPFENGGADGLIGKWARGMASADADSERILNGGSLYRQMVDLVYPYTEGKKKWNALRDPESIGAFLLLCKMRLQSLMSYTGVRTFDKRNHLHQLQEKAPMYFADKT